MIRVVALPVIVFAVWMGARWVIDALKGRDIDWRGVAFAAGFVVLAFWLRSVTGIG